MRVAISAVLVGLSFVFSPLTGFAADGDLDPSFGTAGVATDPYQGSTASGGLALRSDGKILVAELDTGGLELLRYDTTGVLDPTFGTGGIVTQPAPGQYLNELVVMPNGDLVMLAYSSPAFVLARYDATGAPVASFGTGGVATLPDCGTEFYTFADLAVQPDGKLVVGITSVDTEESSYDACVVRVDAGGVPDPGFGTGGVVALPDWIVGAIALQGDRVLVGGAIVVDSRLTAVTRLGSDGGSEGGFGDGGVFTHGPGAAVADLAVRPNGAVLVVTDDAHVLSLTSNGDLDASFGTGGVVAIEPPPDFFISGGAIALPADGKIVVATAYGETHPPIGPSSYPQVTRLDADGTFDASFGSGGTASSVGGFLSGLALQSDGKILVSAVIPPNIFFPVASVNVGRHIGLTLPCPASPAPGCRGGVAPSGGKLRMDAAATNPKAKMQWSWQKGAATALGDFGDPVGGDDYTLCLYDESGPPTLATGAVVPGGGTCKGKPCWKALGTNGFAYKDGARLRFGIEALKLKAGADGKAQVKIQGRGTTLPAPALPAPLPLRVQLIAENGQCWESVFSATGLTRNDAERFQGKSD